MRVFLVFACSIAAAIEHFDNDTVHPINPQTRSTVPDRFLERQKEPSLTLVLPRQRSRVRSPPCLPWTN